MLATRPKDIHCQHGDTCAGRDASEGLLCAGVTVRKGVAAPPITIAIKLAARAMVEVKSV